MGPLPPLQRRSLSPILRLWIRSLSSSSQFGRSCQTVFQATLIMPTRLLRAPKECLRITAPITAPIVEAPSFPMPDFSTPAAVAPPPPAMSAPVVDNTELIEAKRKIAELEARLAQIGGVSR